MRLKDVRMANGASVLAHWRANHPGAVVSRDQYMVREVTSGVMIPVQFLKVVQLPSEMTQILEQAAGEKRRANNPTVVVNPDQFMVG
ncbi:hypothetical protein B9Z55_003451 [Caenorhabditis nigoni]|uniref:Uncharacterized protein n=1 Tax=Caenorhabditis nigoni TaxID=1611254 RepID=A0A2G5VQW0_9PELO|nr:hypothetical protein B9Z55_003451 [Caenorhabditis nigoni]